LKLQAVEAIPLTQMHISPKPMAPKAAAERIAFLNQLSLDDLGADKAMNFTTRLDGSGIACFDQDLPYSQRAGILCR
jgi:hypothetical protein